MQNHSQLWVIGDIQGCAQSLHALLQHPDLSHPDAQFLFVGDLVNRGPDSAGVLRCIMSLKDKAHSVLGNHDIHLLAVSAGVRNPSPSDTLDSVLQAEDAPALLEWLRYRPLAIHIAGHLLIHAGLHPSWNLKTVLKRANRVEQVLRSPTWQTDIANLFGNTPSHWSKTLSAVEKNRFTVNMLTRLRQFDARGKMDTKDKGAPCPDSGLTPWFAMPNQKIELPVVFGHWSTLGLYLSAQAIGIDTGCLWGGQLTAIRLSDRKVVQVPNLDSALAPL